MRFVHTGDWQLGMSRYFLDEEAQARFAQARFDVLRQIGRVAERFGARFVVACGDVFESNRVDRRTVLRALEALGSVPVPVFLLPGNHDPLEPGSVFTSSTFLEHRPDHVHVIASPAPVEVAPGVELVGAPWRSKRPLGDTVAEVLAALPPRTGLRILAAHGAVDALTPQRREPATICLAGVEAALADRLDYLALGDRHSWTPVGRSGRVFYAGAPEPTDFDEVAPGYVLCVELEPGAVRVEAERVATWQFRREAFALGSAADLGHIEETLRGIESKERTVVELVLSGSLPLSGQARLDALLEREREVFGALRVSDTRSRVTIRPEEEDFESLDLEGFGRRALERLRALESGTTADADTARDALRLLVRLCGAAP